MGIKDKINNNNNRNNGNMTVRYSAWCARASCVCTDREVFEKNFAPH